MMLGALWAGIASGPVAAGLAVGTTRYVDDDGKAGPSNCKGSLVVPTSIQAAVDTALPGDTILVCPGTYVGQVSVTTADLTIRAFKPWTATLLPRKDHPTNDQLMTIVGASGVRIQWLRFRARTVEPCEQVGGMIYVSNSPNTQIRSNNVGIRGTDGLGPCGFASGIVVRSSDGSTVAWNTVTDFKSAGIEGRDTTSGLRIHNNEINFFHATHAPLAELGQAGIVVQDSPGALVNYNLVRSLPTAGDTTPSVSDGILLYNAPATVNGNKVQYAQSGLGALVTNGGSLLNNVVTHSLSQGIVLGGSDNMTVDGNSAKMGNGPGMYLWDSSDGNSITNGDFDGNTGNDCLDQSTGAGTDGTANTWTNDIGSDPSPSGICAAP